MAQILSLRTFEIVQQMQYMNEKNIREIAEKIENLTQIKTYCIILHDKDTKEDGSLKEPHFHAVITLHNNMTVDTIAKTVGVGTERIQKILTTTKAAQQYLIHLNHPNKYQYPKEDVIANFNYNSIIETATKKINKKKIAELIECGQIKPYNLTEYISTDEYATNKVYYNRCFEYRQQKLQNGERQMDCIFITGPAGTGKTTYAKILAKGLNYNVYVSAGGKNPLDDYAGQECIILDDTRDSTFPMTDFLKLTDNHTDSLVGCRYYNKSIAECKLLIVTSVKSIGQFYKNAIEIDKEPQIQLYRRFSSVIQVTNEYLTFNVYDDDNKKFVVVSKSKNPITFGKEQMKKRKDLVNKITNCTNLEKVDTNRVGKPMLEEVENDDKIPF